MATYWISALGDDLNGGSDYTDAKLTFASAIPLLTAKGDILNVANDGNIAWPVSTTGISLPTSTKGTSFTDFGTMIRGVTSTGAPARAFIHIHGSDGNVIHLLVRIGSTAGWLIFRNIVFDMTGAATNTVNQSIVTWNDTNANPAINPGPFLMEGCEFLGAALGVRPGSSRFVSRVTSSAVGADGYDYANFNGCYFQNHRGDLISGGPPANIFKKPFERCVFYQDWTTGQNESVFDLNATNSALVENRLVNCHYYAVIGPNTANPVAAYQVAGGNAGLEDFYNNAVYIDSTNADPDINFLGGGGGVSTTRTGTIDYNILVGGPNVAAGDIHDTESWYEAPWDEGQDPKTNDIVAVGVAEAAIFNAPGSTYAWDPLGNGITITLPKDLRLIAPYDALGLGSILRGALPGLGIDMSVGIATSDAMPLPLHEFTITVTASCTGANATVVEYTIPIPAGIEFLSDAPSTGSYDSVTGIWTIGSMAAGSPETLDIVVRPLLSSENMSIVFTATVTDFLPASDTFLDNNTDSLVILVDTYEKRLASVFDTEKILASQVSNEKILASQSSTEKVVLP